MNRLFAVLVVVGAGSVRVSPRLRVFSDAEMTWVAAYQAASGVSGVT